MARYTYNEGLVSQTIDTLGDACKSLDQTNTDINKGISTILNARGAENMNIDFSPILDYQPTVVDYIDQFTGELKSKAQEIEEYENAPWWKKLFATIGMGALKIIEGFIGVNENVIDGLVSVVGFIGGLFSSEFKDSVGEFIKKDWVGDTTAKWYTEGWLQGLNKYSYMSHESTAANILKGVGNAAGYVAISFIPYVGPALSIAASTAGAVGSGTQAGLQQGMSYNQAFGQGMKQGAVALATSLIAKGVANKLTSIGTAAGAVDDVANGAVKTSKGILAGVSKAGLTDDMAGLLDDTVGLLDDTANLASNGAKIAENMSKLKAAGAFASLGDDAINSLDDMAKVAGNLGANYSVGAAKAGEYAGKIPGANAVKGAAGKLMTNPTVSKVVTGAGKTVAKAAAASPNVVSAATAGISSVASGATSGNEVSSAYRQFNTEYAEYEEKVAFVEDNYEAVRGDAVPTTATEEEAKQNLQTLKDNGYNPGSGSPKVEEPTTVPTDGTPTDGTPTDTTPTVTPQPTTSPSGPTGPKPTVTTAPITYPTPVPTQAPYNPTPAPTQPSLDDVVNNVIIDPNPTYAPNVDPVTSITDVTDTSETVLNTFGDVSGAVTGAGSRTNIPTSSSPILSSEDSSASNKSMLPLGAGLGAAALSGIGAKVMMDRNAKKKEEEQDIETDEWVEQDSMEIDYQQSEDSTEADYLNPTDELAFQE